MSDELRDDEGTGIDPADKPSLGRRVRGAVTELVVVVVSALIISALLRAFVGQMFIIPSGSMQHTLEINDRVVVSKVTDYKRGDIVVFSDNDGWILDRPKERSTLRKIGETIGVLPSTSTNHLVKRLIGLPGDHVQFSAKTGRLMVNGTALDESAYLNSVSGAPSDFEFDVVVPADRVFVMGDHRDESGDSRCHLRDVPTDGRVTGMSAFVPTRAIVGPAVAIAAPLDRLTTFHVPDTFAAVPAAKSIPAEPSISITNPTC